MAGEKGTKIGERIRGAGLRLTPQRLAVLEYLQRTPGHKTAEQIGAELNRGRSRAARATVYNALRALRDAGLVSEVRLDGSTARYDVNLSPHHHFICRRCGRIEDVSAEAFGPPPACEVGEGYAVEACEIVLRGLCPACARRGKKG
ncbi:MAG TPA: Fur family transcriptional regulator [Pyrinomonadaceae bacterium]|nr:Fur family transcriptional regulator [Pyrinomonadaceae bacterium]